MSSIFNKHDGLKPKSKSTKEQKSKPTQKTSLVGMVDIGIDTLNTRMSDINDILENQILIGGNKVLESEKTSTEKTEQKLVGEMKEIDSTVTDTKLNSTTSDSTESDSAGNTTQNETDASSSGSDNTTESDSGSEESESEESEESEERSDGKDETDSDEENTTSGSSDNSTEDRKSRPSKRPINYSESESKKYVLTTESSKKGGKRRK